MNTKTNRQESELQPQHQPIITSLTSFRNLRCMCQTFEPDFITHIEFRSLLEDIDYNGFDDLSQNEFWAYDVETETMFPTKPRPELNELIESGGIIFLLIIDCHKDGHGTISGLVKVWDVNDLPPVLDKIFKMVPEELKLGRI